MEFTYCKAEKVRLRDCGHDEKWLQQKIQEDVTILGLGELNILTRERKQSTGGRIDFLLGDSESDTLYEVEIQLGATDESHIIRTIEYWDIESKRFPTKEHRAVIVAEEITNRFFNVISLMNRSIPIIAIQLNALVLEGKLILNFTKVLDIYESPEDEEMLAGKAVDRSYWEKAAHPKSMKLMDSVIAIAKEGCDVQRVTYNENHVALGTARKNFIWLEPRKKEGYCYISFEIGTSNMDEAKELLDGGGVTFSKHKDNSLALSLTEAVFAEKREILKKMIVMAFGAKKTDG